MAIVRVQLARCKLLVILLYVMCSRYLQQVVAGVHLFAERVQGANHLRYIRDDWVGLLVGHLGQEVVGYRLVEAELHLLRVYQHYLQLSRMFLVEQ